MDYLSGFIFSELSDEMKSKGFHIKGKSELVVEGRDNGEKMMPVGKRNENWIIEKVEKLALIDIIMLKRNAK